MPFVHSFSSEIDEAARTILKDNFSPEILYEDIMSRDNAKAPFVDLYCAGFPCQPFSTMGSKQGFEDKLDRGLIFFKIYEYLKLKQPTAFILENVKGLKSIDNGGVF